MRIHHATLETCAAATGSVVVIDVWRSFTTAAFAFAAGARNIVAVDSPEKALALRDRFPGALLLGRGELGGPPAKGFNFSNSPSALIGRDLRGRCMVQCTPNGTRGIVRSVKADTLLASSFVCARATVGLIKRKSPTKVTLVATDEMGEDQACADYIAALLRDETPDAAAVLGSIREGGLQGLRALASRRNMTEAQRAQLEADLNCCLSLDRFGFAMLVERREGLLMMEALR